MRDLYLDVNEFFDKWARKIVIGDPYKKGCTYYFEGEGVKQGYYSDPHSYKTRLLSKRSVV